MLAGALRSEATASGLALLDSPACRQHAVQSLCTVGAIQSPSGHEHERAAEVAAQMRAAGLSDVRITGEPNVLGVVPGRTDRSLVFIATLDDLASVAELQRAGHTPPRLAVGQGLVEDPRWGKMDSSGERVVGPGSNCSVSTAAILSAAEVLVKTYDGERTLVFAAVAQEETGMSGMKALYSELRSTADAFVDVLGDGHRCVAHVDQQSLCSMQLCATISFTNAPAVSQRDVWSTVDPLAQNHCDRTRFTHTAWRATTCQSGHWPSCRPDSESA
jgi:acetylornithine deacetylase/succinyl-diaminopimelate desuccinylase-like protein